MRPLGLPTAGSLLVQPLHSGLRFCNQTVILLLTACTGLLDDLCGLLLGGSKLRGVRGLLLLGLGETLVRLIERAAWCVRAVRSVS